MPGYVTVRGARSVKHYLEKLKSFEEVCGTVSGPCHSRRGPYSATPRRGRLDSKCVLSAEQPVRAARVYDNRRPFGVCHHIGWAMSDAVDVFQALCSCVPQSCRGMQRCVSRCGWDKGGVQGMGWWQIVLV